MGIWDGSETGWTRAWLEMKVAGTGENWCNFCSTHVSVVDTGCDRKIADDDGLHFDENLVRSFHN